MMSSRRTHSVSTGPRVEVVSDGRRTPCRPSRVARPSGSPPPLECVPENDIERRFVTLSVEDAEALQGFDRGWTDAGERARKSGVRFKLIGNAVTTRVSRWVAESLAGPRGMNAECVTWERTGAWPVAAWGDHGRVHRVDVSEFPRLAPYEHLSEVVDVARARPLSPRAMAGFHHRLLQGNLGRHPGFREDVTEVVASQLLFTA